MHCAVHMRLTHSSTWVFESVHWVFGCLAFVLILLCFSQVPCRCPSKEGCHRPFLSSLGCQSDFGLGPLVHQEPY